MGDTVCCPDHKPRTKVLITQSAQSAGSQVSPSLGIAFSQGECLFQGYISSTEVAHINDLWVWGYKGQAPWPQLGTTPKGHFIPELPAELAETYDVTASGSPPSAQSCFHNSPTDAISETTPS